MGRDASPPQHPASLQLPHWTWRGCIQISSDSSLLFGPTKAPPAMSSVVYSLLTWEANTERGKTIAAGSCISSQNRHHPSDTAALRCGGAKVNNKKVVRRKRLTSSLLVMEVLHDD